MCCTAPGFASRPWGQSAFCCMCLKWSPELGWAQCNQDSVLFKGCNVGSSPQEGLRRHSQALMEVIRPTNFQHLSLFTSSTLAHLEAGQQVNTIKILMTQCQSRAVHMTSGSAWVCGKHVGEWVFRVLLLHKLEKQDRGVQIPWMHHHLELQKV